MYFRRVAATILLSSMLTGMALSFSSCKKKKNNEPRSSNVIIKEDDPWYKADIYNPCDFLDPYNEIESFDYYTAVFGDKLFVSKSGGIDYGDDTYSYYNRMFGLFDLEGNLICQNEYSYDLSIVDQIFLGVTAEGDDFKIPLLTHSSAKEGYVLNYITWDTDSNTLSEPVPTDLIVPGDDLFQAVQSDNILVTSSNVYGEDYYTSSMTIDVFEDSEHIGSLDLSETECEAMYLDYIYDTGDSIVIEGESWETYAYYSGERVRITFDKASRSFGDFSSYYSDGVTNEIEGFDGRRYMLKSDGIYCGDELYLSYVECDVNLLNMYDVTLLSVEEDRVILAGKDLMEKFTLGLRIITLEKQSRNPNAGKMLINALAVTELKNDQYEAILRYNRADNKYFIKPVVRSVTELDLFTSEQLQQYYDSVSQEIKSETGPDLVFNSYVLSAFMNDDYFLDMSEDIEMKYDEYYSEIYDFTATGDKHYIIPSGFLINGVMIPKDYMDKEGFTFDKYREFVTSSCEDNDPISYSYTRKRYLELLLNSMSSSWLKDGKADFNTEEFRSLLTFVKEFVPATDFENDQGYFTEFLYPYPYERKTPPYTFISGGFFGTYTSALVSDSNLKLCGIPSYDGAGPDAQIISSVSVCANTGVKDACIDFTKYLLSTEVQLNNDYISVNRKAMSMLQSNNYQNDAKEFKDNLAKFQSEAIDRNDNLYDPLERTQNQLDSLTDDFERADVYDMTVVYIILEESRGYLDGEKDLDTVISSINTKVQSYLDSLG